MSTTTDLWLRRFAGPPATARRVICFPHAGASANFYLPFARSLAGHADVLSIQYPGRQDRFREQPLSDIGELADAIYSVLRDLADEPMVFFGHSMGAIAAYEVARRMERATGTVLHRLFVSGRRAPSTRRAEQVHLSTDEGLLQELRRLNGTDMQLLGDDEMLQMILPALRGDYRAIETYRHVEGPELHCPLTVLVGDDDPVTTVAEAGEWVRHTSAHVDVKVFSGGHFFLTDHQASIVATIADHLR